MVEKTKLKWLRKEFSSSEELEFYLTQLKHQDKLKSDIISLLERFQHLLFASYEPDFLTITYNGQWDVTFGPVASETFIVEPQTRKEKIRKAGFKSESDTLSFSSSEKTKVKDEKAETELTLNQVISARVTLKTLLDTGMIATGEKLRYKNRPGLFAIITREGRVKVGKEEFQSLSAAATSVASSGRRDGWLCWLFQDQDAEWKPIDLLRKRWREKLLHR